MVDGYAFGLERAYSQKRIESFTLCRPCVVVAGVSAVGEGASAVAAGISAVAVIIKSLKPAVQEHQTFFHPQSSARHLFATPYKTHTRLIQLYKSATCTNSAKPPNKHTLTWTHTHMDTHTWIHTRNRYDPPCDHDIPHSNEALPVLHGHPRCARDLSAFASQLLLLGAHNLVHPGLVPDHERESLMYM